MNHSCEAKNECPIKLFIKLCVSIFSHGLKCPVFLEGPVDYDEVYTDITKPVESEKPVETEKSATPEKPLDDIVNVDQWKLTLPIIQNGKLVELKTPESIRAHRSEFFRITPQGLCMKAPCDGATTQNSKYPRCEFREYAGTEVFWNAMDKPRSMTYSVACLHLPKNKPEIVVGQLHDRNDDVFEIKYSGLPKPTLKVFHDSITYGTLGEFELGQFVTLSIEIVKGVCKISHSKAKVEFKMAATDDCYFKIGCYVQSNASKGDGGDYGEVVYKAIYCE